MGFLVRWFRTADPLVRWLLVVIAFGIPLSLIDFTLIVYDPTWLKAVRYTLTVLFLLHVFRGAWRFRFRWPEAWRGDQR